MWAPFRDWPVTSFWSSRVKSQNSCDSSISFPWRSSLMFPSMESILIRLNLRILEGRSIPTLDKDSNETEWSSAASYAHGWNDTVANAFVSGAFLKLAWSVLRRCCYLDISSLDFYLWLHKHLWEDLKGWKGVFGYQKGISFVLLFSLMATVLRQTAYELFYENSGEIDKFIGYRFVTVHPYNILWINLSILNVLSGSSFMIKQINNICDSIKKITTLRLI